MILLIVILILIVIMLGSIYNKFVRLKTHVDEAWAQIDVHLKRRCDLIPNLVETAKGYAKYERETLERVIQARNAMLNPNSSRADVIEQNAVIESGLKSIFALSESYPELKSNSNFVIVQEELISTENKIAFTRQLYNSSVANYNLKIRSFPSNIIAGIFNFREEKMLEARAEEREVVKVSF